MGHEIGDVGDGGRAGREPRDQVPLDDAPDPLGPFRPASPQVFVGGVHPGAGDRRDVGLDTERLGLCRGFARGARLGSEPVRVGQRRSLADGGDGLGEPGSGVGLSHERLLAAAGGAPGLGDAHPPQALVGAQRPGERPTHQAAPRLAKVSMVEAEESQLVVLAGNDLFQAGDPGLGPGQLDGDWARRTPPVRPTAGRSLDRRSARAAGRGRRRPGHRRGSSSGRYRGGHWGTGPSAAPERWCPGCSRPAGPPPSG